MQLLLLAAAFLSLSARAFAQNTSFSTTITYDTLYDNGNASTTSISCSNGNNGVICKGSHFYCNGEDAATFKFARASVAWRRRKRSLEKAHRQVSLNTVESLMPELSTHCALTLSEIPGWPNITGAPSRVIAGWNADGCRTCWALTLPDYANTTFFVRAVNAGGDGFNVGFDLLNAVTDGQALSAGRVRAVARSVGPAACEQGQRPIQPPPRPQATCPPPNFGCQS